MKVSSLRYVTSESSLNYYETRKDCVICEITEAEKIRRQPGGTLGFFKAHFAVGQRVAIECIALDPVQDNGRLRPTPKFKLHINCLVIYFVR